MSRNKINRNTVPEDFTMSLVLVDAVPVLLFGISMVVVSILLKSTLFMIGALLCLYAGAAKVLWKLIVVCRKKNVWWMFLQMRYVMPVGMLLMLAGGILDGRKGGMTGVVQKAMQMPAVLFFAGGIAGMAMMMVFAFMLDSSDVKSNWIEQIVNGIAQACFLIGLMCLL